MMKRILSTVLILAAISAAILFWMSYKQGRSIETNTTKVGALGKELQIKPANPLAATGLPTADLLPKVTMKVTEYEIDYAAWARELSDSPFHFRGQGTSGRVVDSQGNIIINSSNEFGIYGISLSPSKKKILVKGGDGKNLVIEPSTNQRVSLPFKPPGSNLFPFEWHWIGPNLLFGVSGVEKVFHEESHENCCNDNNATQTKFYTFDLMTERLSEVAMPDAVTQPVVNVLEVMSDGHIHLLHEEPNEGVEQDLGWFKIDARDLAE